MKTRMLLAGAATVAVVAAFALTATAKDAAGQVAGTKADNFLLADQQGVGHELYYYKSNPAVVVLSHQYGDKASERAVAEIEKVRAAYEAKGVVFFALNSS